MKNSRGIAVRLICALLFILGSSDTHASDIDFSGKLDSIQMDEGGGVYSGVPIGTDFVGRIDDNGAGGFISDGTTRTSFSCCISASTLSVSNDMAITLEEATFLNEVYGSQRYSAGDIIDSVNIEGDENTAAGGRIEIGVSYILPANTFNNSDLGNYPVNQNDIELALFFIFEENSSGQDIYSAGGKITMPLTCADIAGQWQGNWSETSCDTNHYADTWTGIVSSDCTFTGTDNWDAVSGTINPSNMALTATGISQDGCGSINVSGTFTSDSVSGSYTYSVSGSGTFTGSIIGGGNTVDNGGGSSGGGGGGGCFIDDLIH